MPKYKCLICNNESYKKLFEEKDPISYQLVKCRSCNHESLFPIPDEKDLLECYKSQYFEKRTDRGYNNYFSNNVKNEIQRVFKMNLRDLDFEKFEKSLSSKTTSLDIGCAAGYFVAYMKDRGWQSAGIDVSPSCIKFAKESLKLNVSQGSYIEKKYKVKFNLISLWATIEHLADPGVFLEKINNDLANDGILYISTCRTGRFNFKNLFGKNWRYYNFPEHIHFFSFKNLKRYLSSYGFEVKCYFTYGSGISNKIPLFKNIADFAAKKFYLGDMMIISAAKRGSLENNK